MAVNLKGMSATQLLMLRDDVDAALLKMRKDLEAQLVKIDGISTPRAPRSGRKRKSAGVKVAPKYRNPADPKETWAGRGMRPRWLVAALKAGKKLESFAIKK